MSQWIDVLNRLRHGASAARLVRAQVEASASVAALLRTHDVVNLHGPRGSGKTYLGWVLARVTSARHVASPGRLAGEAVDQPGLGARSPGRGGDWTHDDLSDVAIVDNCPSARLGARRVVDDARWQGFRRVVLVTRVAVPDHVPGVELRLAVADLDAISTALGALGWALPPGSAGEASLWGRIWGDGDAPAGASAADTISGTTITHA